MKQVSVSGEVRAPLEQVWGLLRDFGSIDRYAGGISSCVIEGHDVGAVRTLTVASGVICEQLLKVDEKNRSVIFAIISSPLPMSSCISTIRVKSLSADRCEVTWSSVFELKQTSSAKNAESILTSVYQSGIEGLERAAQEERDRPKDSPLNRRFGRAPYRLTRVLA